MRASCFVVVLSLVVLSTVALAGDSSTQAAQAEALNMTLADGPTSRGVKTEVPGLMNYQGTLTDVEGIALDTTVSMTFSIYPLSAGGTAVWKETQPTVLVSNGIFNVLLGSVNSIPDTVFKDPERWLGVQVGDDPELVPRQRIAAAGYAFKAAEADTASFARNTLGGADGDWTIAGSDMYAVVSGFVGIGTPSPVYKLDIRGSHPDDGVVLGIGNSDLTHRLMIYGGRQNDPNPYIHWKDGDPLRFTTDQGGWSEKMRITSDGKLGLGTENPHVMLDVGDMVCVRGNNWPGAGKGLELAYSGGLHQGYVQVYDRDASSWGDLYLGDGNVGIGYTSPSYKLHVRGVLGLGNTYTSEFPDYGYGPASIERLAVWDDFGGQDNPILSSMRADDGSNFYELAFLSKARGSTRRALAFRQGTLGTGGTETWYIGYNGNAYFGDKVGIGTSSPAEQLEIYKNQNERTILRLNNPNAGIDAGSSIYFYEGEMYQGYIASHNSGNTTALTGPNSLAIQSYNGPIRISTIGGFPIILFPNDSNVGIGTTNPSEKLEVAGTIYGHSTDSTGVRGESNGGSAYGVWGENSLGAGVGGQNSNSGDLGKLGGLGWGVSGSSASGNGVEGHNTGSGNYGYLGTSTYGVYYSGGLGGTGSKSAIVRTEEGPKAVYCQESPENWFEDFGSGAINGGSAHIQLAHDFRQTVTIDNKNPMKVFITPNAPIGGEWWVEKNAAGFTLVAPKAPDDSQFDYRVVAKRRGFEDLRLKSTPVAYADHFLYPDVSEVPVEYREEWLKSASAGEQSK